ncbi:hypothetical protein GF380_02080 [Candidatus Uhrbacteria bacterium]|nr:hypothetical protein [Candidatus Uhrbacteria bacterium]
MDSVIASAERIDVTFRNPSVYYLSDGQSKDYPPPDGWKDMIHSECERLGWNDVYWEEDGVDAYIQEIGERYTAFGTVLYIKVRRYDGGPMGWEELYQVYSDSYPNSWAVRAFPPHCELVNDANVYHLFVLQYEPGGLNIRR